MGPCILALYQTSPQLRGRQEIRTGVCSYTILSIYIKCCEISFQVLFPSFYSFPPAREQAIQGLVSAMSHLQFVNLYLGMSLPPLQEADEGNSGPPFMLWCQFLCRRKGSAILRATPLCLVVPCRHKLLLCCGSLERTSQHTTTPPLLQPSH